MKGPTPEFEARLALFVAGCQAKLAMHWAKIRYQTPVPEVKSKRLKTRALVYRHERDGAVTELSYVDYETGNVLLPKDSAKRARGNIFLPDHGLKNIGADGRPAFVR
jgi:hypothetical protein